MRRRKLIAAAEAWTPVRRSKVNAKDGTVEALAKEALAAEAGPSPTGWRRRLLFTLCEYYGCEKLEVEL